MRKILLLCQLLMPVLLSAQSKDLKKVYDAAVNAYREKNYGLFYKNISEASKLHPYNQTIMYLKAKASALTGRNEEAIASLNAAIQIYAAYPLEGVADFKSIKDSQEFAELLKKQKEYSTSIIHSDTAFTLRDRSLHTEGIDYDSESRQFFIGSIHKRKIIKLSPAGEVADFCPAGYEGLTSIFGVKVDKKRKLLWACSSPMPEMENFDTVSRSEVFKFDLATGKLLQKFLLTKSGKDGIFGDIVLSPTGNLYVSDTKNNQLLKVNEKKNQLEAFYSSPEFWNIQGFAFSPQEDYLFISDYIKGIFRLTLKSQELIQLVPPDNFSLKGIDGLYFHENSLLAIQNGVTPNRLTQYVLDDKMSRIQSVKVIDRAHPAFGEPTLGVIAGEYFYYIANSQWDGYDDQYHIKPDDQLRDIVVLKVKW